MPILKVRCNDSCSGDRSARRKPPVRFHNHKLLKGFRRRIKMLVHQQRDEEIPSTASLPRDG